MCLIMIADLVTGWVGKDLVINEFVYDSFVFVVLGCFGIAGLEKFAKNKDMHLSKESQKQRQSMIEYASPNIKQMKKGWK